MAQASEARYQMMTETPIPSLIRAMSVPPIISMLITSLYNLADTFFVSQINTSASAAVGVVFSLMAINQAIGQGLGMGAGMNISRLLGQKDLDRAHLFAATSFYTGLIVGALLTVGGLIFLENLVIKLGATPTIVPYAMDYCRIILIGCPFMISSFIMNITLRSQGNSFLAMIGIGAGALLNIVLDPIFIFVFGWGIAGAAAATVLSQIISFFLLIYLTKREPAGAKIHPRYFRPGWALYRPILSNGLPSFYRQMLASFSSIILNFCAAPYGDAAIAAMSIVARLCYFLISFILGFGQGFMPVAGFNYGAKKYKRVWDSFFFCQKLAVSFLFCIAIIAYWQAPAIITIFRKDDLEVIRIGALALRLQCFVLPLQAWCILCNMLTQSLGKSIQATIMALSRQGIFLLPSLLILSSLLGLLGIQCSQPIADALTFVMSLITTLPVIRMLRQQSAASGVAGQEREFVIDESQLTDLEG
jgi:putative MATE family efflux protein